MDERVKLGFQKMYAELFQIILVLCCVSFIVKTIFLELPISDFLPEFSILVGSPIYLAIRSRTLGITQLGIGSANYKKQKRTSLIAALLGFLLVFITTAVKRGRMPALPILIVYIVIFIVCFLLTYKIYHIVEKKRQEKLDSRYDE